MAVASIKAGSLLEAEFKALFQTPEYLMKCFATLTLLAVATTQAAAHYRWTSLTIDGARTADWQYVRRIPTNSPITGVNSKDITCGIGGSLSGTTQTAVVTAGLTITFNVDQPIYHRGVINVYMAKAPNTAVSFDGSGAVWFKIAELPAVTDGGRSITFPADKLSSFPFQIPSTLSTGEYLIRIEHIALHNASTSGPEFYVSCAQVKVVGGGFKVPSPLVAFPGYYTGREAGLTVDIYWPVPAVWNQPGPAVWSG